MASTYASSFLCCSTSSSSSAPSSTSVTRFCLPFSQYILNGSSHKKGWFNSRIYAKFEKFQNQPSQYDIEETTQVSPESLQIDDEGEEDDRFIPCPHFLFVCNTVY